MQSDRQPRGRRAGRQGPGRFQPDTNGLPNGREDQMLVHGGHLSYDRQQMGGYVGPTANPGFMYAQPGLGPTYGPQLISGAIDPRMAQAYGSSIMPHAYPQMGSYMYQHMPQQFPMPSAAFTQYPMPPFTQVQAPWQQQQMAAFQQPYPQLIQPSYWRNQNPQFPSPTQRGPPLQRPQQHPSSRGPPVPFPRPPSVATSDLNSQLEGMSLGKPNSGHESHSGGEESVTSAQTLQADHAAKSAKDPLNPPPKSSIYAIDVECVATGERCWDREVAQIAVVDESERLVLNLFVKPKKPVKSYITGLTGLTKEILEEKGVTFEEAMQVFHQTIPANAKLISYNVDSDLRWLDLEYKVRRNEVLDLKGCYQQDAETKAFTRRVWGQDHIARALLGWDSDQHDAAGDALKTIKLWNLFSELKKDPVKHKEALDTVDNMAKEPSFSMRNPRYEGVCMGNRRTCVCRKTEHQWRPTAKSQQQQTQTPTTTDSQVVEAADQKAEQGNS